MYRTYSKQKFLVSEVRHSKYFYDTCCSLFEPMYSTLNADITISREPYVAEKYKVGGFVAAAAAAVAFCCSIGPRASAKNRRLLPAVAYCVYRSRRQVWWWAMRSYRTCFIRRTTALITVSLTATLVVPGPRAVSYSAPK